MNWKLRAFMAGEPQRFLDADTGGGGGDTPGEGGADKSPSEFDMGYGKGVAKGEAQGVQNLLAGLGVSSVDDLKAMQKRAAEAEATKRKEAEEQGQFKELLTTAESEKKTLAEENATMKARLDAIEATQKAELDTLSEKLTEDDQKLIGSLPLEQGLAMAKRLTAATTPGVGAPPAGNGNPPGSGGAGMTLEEAVALVNKKGGFGNLSPEEHKQVTEVIEKNDPGA